MTLPFPRQVSLAELPALRAAATAAGETIALANGVFDLFHVGHLRYLQGARREADLLVVAVNDDVSTRANKGPGRPLVPEAERAEIVAGLACVDHVVLFGSRDVVPVIRALHPDVHVKGTDYTPETIPEAAEVRAYGGRVAVAGDPKQHSTTEMVAKLEAARKTRSTENAMPVAPELKEILACPRCKGALEFRDEADEIRCPACRLAFRVEDGIPVMLLDEARPLDA